MIATPAENCLIVNRLSVRFEAAQPFEAVQELSFALAAGKTLALIGQSGSGKSVTSLALMGLLPANARISGSIQLQGVGALTALRPQDWPAVRGKAVGMVFQEPMTALNPVKTCGYQLIESIRAHQDLSTKAARRLALQWFEKVKLPDPIRLLRRYPHQLSGGQKQRVMIAMAMCNHPTLLIADEPTTALDVTVQKEIIQLMKSLQQEYGTAILFITHDLALARTLADDYLVLEKGKMVTAFPQVKEINMAPTPALKETPLLSVQDLAIRYPEKINWLGKTVKSFTAVDRVSFDLYPGETLGLVGESGCGKSTLSRSILGLQPATEGHIYFEGQDITQFTTAQWRRLRKDIQIVFQDPYASLNQRIRVGDSLAEPLLVHGIANAKTVDKYVDELLEKVKLPAAARHKYPHEFSGGQRQRICIARALAVQPRLIICDESVSALDVTIQEQILELLATLQQQMQLTYLFITHDLTVVKRISNRIIVMEKGKIVEQGATQQVLEHPVQAYTQRLLAAIPGL
ncbi:ABC transporter ATP-binding protein [Taibaiella koreensis]|uniref:ABC transporter ATP-binding protein n=1 Tax=Taibaiella koreensis TaxID=1268548 RepID=UPI000E59A2A6|nr:ABC transporter ATP-binding protein [Taibaiella koreensis]